VRDPLVDRLLEKVRDPQVQEMEKEMVMEERKGRTGVDSARAFTPIQEREKNTAKERTKLFAPEIVCC
jgi:hypothetical protein